MRYDKKTEKAMIAKLPDEFVVYKVVDTKCWAEDTGDGKGYWPEFGRGRFKKGICVSDPPPRAGLPSKGPEYICHFHSFRTVKGVKDWGTNFHEKMVACRVKREWVTAIGKQKRHVVIVSEKIIMPSSSDKTAIVA